jgi:hypothetical protein
VNGNEARGLVPPRPNLGPESWREPAAASRLMLATGIAMLASVLIAWLWWRRRGALRARRAAATVAGLAAVDPAPRVRLVGLSGSIREALTVQFGSSFRAKTTQELSTDDRLAQLLGPEGFEELIQFLDRIDLLKFAPERPDDHDEALGELLSSWEPRVAGLSARIRVKPRARTRTSRSAPANGSVPPGPGIAAPGRK